jgi:polysaccharide transporter, PST family
MNPGPPQQSMIGVAIEKLREQGGGAGLLRHPLIKNALLLYVVQIGSYLFPLAILPFLSRVLHPDNFGLVVFAQTFIWYFITLSDYGFGLTATRKVAAHQDQPEALSRIFSSVMTTKVLLASIGFVLMVAITLALPKMRPHLLLFTVTYLNVVGNTIFPLWFFQGMQLLKHVAIRDFISKLSSMVLMFLIVRQESDYIWAAGLQSGGAVISGVIGLAQAHRIMRLDWSWPGWDAIRAELLEGWPVFLSMAAMTLTGLNILILGLWATAAEVGYFSAAFRIATAVRIMVTPVVTVLYPHLSKLATKDKQHTVQFLRKYGLLLASPFGAISLVLMLGAPWIVPVVFGPLYNPTILLLQILALSPFLLAIQHNYSTYYMLANGYDKQWMRLTVCGVALNFVILFPLLWTISATRATAITSLVVDLFGATAAYIFFRRTAMQSDRIL